MNQFEMQIWAASFANAFESERQFHRQHGDGAQVSNSIWGFTCAEIADGAIEKFRQAIDCEDAKYLNLIKEGYLNK